MTSNAIVAVILTGCILFLSACSFSRVRPDAGRKDVEVPTHHLAWMAARNRLHAMCPGVPKTEAELTQALKTRHANDCYIRYAKDTYLPAIDDWHWHWLPSYRVVAAVHDEELRKRMIPKLYEEYISGLNRYLSERADRAEITPAQFRYAYNAGWSWLTAKMRSERFLLQENVHGTAIPDEATRSAIANIAGELATIATVALSVSAPDKRYEAAPATCHAHIHEPRSYTIQCY